MPLDSHSSSPGQNWVKSELWKPQPLNGHQPFMYIHSGVIFVSCIPVLIFILISWEHKSPSRASHIVSGKVKISMCMHARMHVRTRTYTDAHYTIFTSPRSGMNERRQADFVVCPWIDTQGWSHLIPQAVKSTSSPSSFLMFWQTLSDWCWGCVRRKWGVGGAWRSEERTGARLVPLETPGFPVDVLD